MSLANNMGVGGDRAAHRNIEYAETNAEKAAAFTCHKVQAGYRVPRAGMYLMPFRADRVT